MRPHPASLLLLALPACARACSSPEREEAPTTAAEDAATTAPAAGSLAGHPFRARSAVLVRSTATSPKDHPNPPTLLLFETQTGCDHFDAARLFEPHVRIWNVPSSDGRERVRAPFEYCVAYDDARAPECLIHDEGWLVLEPGSREVGAHVRGHIDLRREPSVKAEENGRIEGTFDATVCDGNVPAGLKLREDRPDVPQ